MCWDFSGLTLTISDQMLAHPICPNTKTVFVNHVGLGWNLGTTNGQKWPHHSHSQFFIGTMNTIVEFILEEFSFVNSPIKRENSHNTQLMKGILSYIKVFELLAVANFIYKEEQEKKKRSKR